MWLFVPTAKNGVVIATEKKLPTILVDETSSKKIAMLSENAGIVYSGLGPDYRVLVRKARKKAQTYFQKYKEHAPASILVRELAAIMQEFTQSGGVRPFGVSILFAGFDDDGPQLYQIDPSGAYFGWKATAIGKDSVSAKTFLERVRTDITLEYLLCMNSYSNILSPTFCVCSVTTTTWRLKTPSTRRCSPFVRDSRARYERHKLFF